MATMMEWMNKGGDETDGNEYRYRAGAAYIF
jgi:hypothetical protein